MTDEEKRSRVLCVDDEPRVLEGIALSLRRRYEVFTANGAMAALDVLHKEPNIAVVLSDMRMPMMDGTAFLHRCRHIAPDTVRIILTGQADLSAAIHAVNEGQVFRFLTKPCPPAVLLPVIEAAVEQHRLITAERVLLEQTLHGAVKALGEVLALTSPTSFGRAQRVARSVSQMAEVLKQPERWTVEVAAMVSQLGFITLPNDVAERVHLGQPLSEEETQQVLKVPYVAEKLLAHIPRLELVRKILTASVRPIRRLPMGADAKSHQLMRAAQMLRIAIDFDDLLARGNTPPAAIAAMRPREAYDPEVLESLAGTVAPATDHDEPQSVPLSALKVGMVVAEDIRMVSGTLLVARGYEVAQSFIERARNFRAGTVQEPVRVFLPPPAEPPPA
ncbi:MAG: HD domain-containing phosphohydrolase [Vicinamibacteraceae bacterium]